MSYVDLSKTSWRPNAFVAAQFRKAGALRGVDGWLPSWLGGDPDLPDQTGVHIEPSQPSPGTTTGECKNLPKTAGELRCNYGFAPTPINNGQCFDCREDPAQTGGVICPPATVPNPATRGCSPPSGDGLFVPDLVNGKVTCPDGTALNQKTGMCEMGGHSWFELTTSNPLVLLSVVAIVGVAGYAAYDGIRSRKGAYR